MDGAENCFVRFPEIGRIKLYGLFLKCEAKKASHLRNEPAEFNGWSPQNPALKNIPIEASKAPIFERQLGVGVLERRRFSQLSIPSVLCFT
jgi:hypothetical protein